MPSARYSFLHSWHLSCTASNACIVLRRNIYIPQRLGANAYGVSSLPYMAALYISAAFFFGKTEQIRPLFAA